MNKIIKIFIIAIFSLIFSGLDSREKELKLSTLNVPWNNYIEWLYFNGELEIDHQREILSMPFIFVIAHQQLSAANHFPQNHTILTLFVNYIDGKPYSHTDSYTINSSTENIKDYLNTDIDNFSFLMPNKNASVKKVKNAYFINFKFGENERLELIATPESNITTNYCHNSFQINPSLPLLAYNYPILKYRGNITIKSNNYKVINGTGFLDYNAWRSDWTRIVKEWIWFSAYSKTMHITFWAFKTAGDGLDNYNIKFVKIIHRNKNIIQEFCNEEFNFDLMKLKNDELNSIIIRSNNLKLKLEILDSSHYKLNRPEYFDDMRFAKIKIINKNKGSNGFAFLEFLKSFN